MYGSSFRVGYPANLCSSVLDSEVKAQSHFTVIPTVFHLPPWRTILNYRELSHRLVRGGVLSATGQLREASV